MMNTPGAFSVNYRTMYTYCVNNCTHHVVFLSLLSYAQSYAIMMSVLQYKLFIFFTCSLTVDTEAGEAGFPEARAAEVDGGTSITR